MSAEARELVVGAIDMHCHHGPDPHRVRSVDAAEAVAEAEALGMAAIVLKSHAYPTGPIAVLMQKTVTRLRVFGGICCDFEVGGLNPAAVEVALRTGAKIVWMPTFSSVVDRRKLHLPASAGLRFFRSLDEAADAIAAVEADYATASHAARRLAADVFATDVVLPGLLAAAGA